MKLKVVFCTPPYENYSETPVAGEKTIYLRSPYELTQTEIGADRVITKVSDGSKVTYEAYCTEMNTFISDSLHTNGIPEHGPYEEIIIEGFKQPPDFNATCTAIKNMPIACTPETKLIFKNCSFGGALYVDSASQLVNSIQKKATKDIAFKLFLDETKPSKLSTHDEARLASLNGVRFFRNRESRASLRPFIDDSFIGVQKRPISGKLENPTYFYRSAVRCR